MSLNNSRGFSAVELMTAMAVCGFVFYLSSDMFVAYTQSQRQARSSVAVMKVQQELLSLLRDEAAWSRTVAAQSGPGQPFRCLTSTTGDCAASANAARPFVPYTSTGALYNGYNPVANARHGFTPEGALCTTFNAANPDPNCPFRFTFIRQFVCGATDCVKPIVNVQMNFDSGVINALNTKVINISPGMLSQPVLSRGIARVVTPRTCGQGEVVIRVSDQGVVECQNWLTLP